MHNMHHADHFMAPAWLIYTLGALFAAGALVYLYRLFNVSAVKKVYGYHDWENEIGHGLCMASMAAMLAPAALQLPAIFWTVTLSAGAVWFFARALTWGRKLAHNKVWWWDWAHVGMLSGMALMFHPLDLGAWFVGLQVAFWLWFSSYYAYETYHELKEPKLLYVQSNLSHLLMGVVMLIMTLWPMALMPSHHNMSAMSSKPNPAVPAPQVAPTVAKADDKNFNAEVFGATQPVVVLVYGGCEKCATEVPIFNKLSAQYHGRVKFVVVHKDESPAVCKQLKVDQCPAVLMVKDGKLCADRLDTLVTQDELSVFIDKMLKN
jgi:thioredoxin 1